MDTEKIQCGKHGGKKEQMWHIDKEYTTDDLTLAATKARTALTHGCGIGHVPLGQYCDLGIMSVTRLLVDNTLLQNRYSRMCFGRWHSF